MLFPVKFFCGEHGTSFHRHIYKSKKHGEQEVWNCKLYRQKGKDDGCNSPTIYSKELHEILNKIYQIIYNQKEKVINELMDMYTLSDSIDYNKDISKIEKDIEKQKIKQDTLLELYIDKSMNKSEFIERNNIINEIIKKLNEDKKHYLDESKYTLIEKQNLIKLKKVMEKELENEDNLNAEVSSVLLNKIIVHKINGDKNHLRLEIILNIGQKFSAEFRKNKECFLSLGDIGISHNEMQNIYKREFHNVLGYYNIIYDIDVKIIS